MANREEEDWKRQIKCKLAYYRKCDYHPTTCKSIDCIYHKDHKK